VHDRAAELRERAPQLELAGRLDRAGARRQAESERVQSAADACLEVVVDGETGLELVRELDERVPVEKRDVGTGGQLCSDRRPGRARLR
jgi:hypothetical protein